MAHRLGWVRPVRPRWYPHKYEGGPSPDQLLSSLPGTATGRWDNAGPSVRGLEAGERIVVSGNFLIDSESRMQTAARPPAISAVASSTVKDPSCGMEIDPAKAAGKSEYNGKTYYFCSKSCKETFDKEPKKYGDPKQMAKL